MDIAREPWMGNTQDVSIWDEKKSNHDGEHDIKRKRYHGKKHHHFDFDFDRMDKEEAKLVAHSFINWTVIAVFIYFTGIFFCVAGCCICAINKVKKN